MPLTSFRNRKSDCLQLINWENTGFFRLLEVEVIIWVFAISLYSFGRKNGFIVILTAISVHLK